MKPFGSMGREELLRVVEMFAKNWLAHDGCWFLAAEERFGIETAIDLDACSWARFAAAEARRILGTFDIPLRGGLPAWVALALLHGRGPRSGGAPAEGLAAFSLQAGRHGGVPDVRGGHRPADFDYLSSLSAGRIRRPVLRLGIHPGRQRRDG